MILANNIEKSFNGEKVLKGISLKIEDGELTAIMGESGSGKSTLLSILGGFLTPDSGEVIINGANIQKLSEGELARLRSTEIGFVFQFFKLIPTLTARENILLPATLGKRIDKESQKTLEELAKKLKLEGVLDKYPEQLSGGQCQRVAIARSILYKPSLIILDEPTGALDSAMEGRVMDLLREVNDKLGTTILMVTHSMKVAEGCKRIINLRDGDIVS
jgi:ABC-type lipoprotein export system ATPase subunit